MGKIRFELLLRTDTFLVACWLRLRNQEGEGRGFLLWLRSGYIGGRGVKFSKKNGYVI